MSKTVKFFEKDYEPILDSRLKFWLIREIKIFDEEFEIEFPLINNEYPSNLNLFLNKIENNWEELLDQSLNGIFCISRFKTHFKLLAIILKDSNLDYEYTYIFYNNKYDKYGQYFVTYNQTRAIEIGREWI